MSLTRFVYTIKVETSGVRKIIHLKKVWISNINHFNAFIGKKKVDRLEKFQSQPHRMEIDLKC